MLETSLKKPIKPELADWLQSYNELIDRLESEGFENTPETARAGLARLTETLIDDIPDIAFSADLQAEGAGGKIPILVYHPDPGIPLPVLLYLHGGGHMAGSIEVYEPICRKLALATQRLVVSVDYRLAPEYPYPAGLQDAGAVLRQLFEILKAGGISFEPRLAIGGDSGGGAMTATLVHRLQADPEVDIEKQLLIYPSLDYTMQQRSVAENGRGYLLHADRMRWYFDHYLQAGEDRRTVSPLFMEFTPRLPATLLVTAAYDPLCDEGFAYVKRLRETGVEHRHLHFADQVHAFVNMEKVTGAACREFYRVAGEFLDGTSDSKTPI